MMFCTSCSRMLSYNAFVLDDKSNKTCAKYLITKAEKKAKNANVEDILMKKISFKQISDYITDSIEQNKNSINFRIILDENTLSIANINVKLIAKLIVDKIEEGDGYNWIATTASNLSAYYQDIGNAYFVCSQSSEIKHEYVNSNRKRINRFDCKGKLIIKVNLLATEVKVTLQHNFMHNKPIDIAVLSEIKQKIKENLKMTPTYLQSYLHKKFDLSYITSKQIYYW
ncbi:15861_t:CDS:2 [Cetraspora pellucida]|uniref:15861_t:CDS:1 n=1 Tax=Cetraspora pellucida TaxID=1433469 RepID=A0ACA9KQU3_9GLOM|nr:15861_t:CDS:2 [Cetraspora pellucida]